MKHPFVAVSISLLAACGGPEDPMDPVDPVDALQPDALLHDFCSATDPRTVPVEILATPEAGEKPYLDALATATTSIDVAIYLMGYGGILDLLEAKARAGVQVRVIVDVGKQDTNQKYYDRLVAAGAQVHWSDPQFSFFHAKFFVVDGRVGVLSTGNFSKTFSIDKERNFAVTDADPADVDDLGRLFEADWARAAPSLPCTRLVVAPINARARILDVIDGASHTLDIESMQFADTGVREAVKRRVAAGVVVRVLLADPSWIDTNAYAATYLNDLGVPVKSIPHLHTKVVIADGNLAYVGSENLSQTSLDRNREVGVVAVEASSIAPLVTTFEHDWAVGAAL